MDKKEFLSQLREGLSSLTQEDQDERLTFYSEMIEDYIEEGMSEEEAIDRIGSPKEIAAQIVADISPAAPKTEDAKANKRLRASVIVLIILGSPIWLSLLIAVFSVVISLYVSIWAVVASLWATVFAIGCSSFGCIIGGVALAATGYGLSGVALFAAALICAGLTVHFLFICVAATKGTVLLTKWVFTLIKRLLTKKEAAK